MFSSDIIRVIVSFNTNLNLRLVCKAFAEPKYHISHNFKNTTNFVNVINVFEIHTFTLNYYNILNSRDIPEKFYNFINKQLPNCKIFICKHVEILKNNYIPENCTDLVFESCILGITKLPEKCKALSFVDTKIIKLLDLSNIEYLSFKFMDFLSFPESLPNCKSFHCALSFIDQLPKYLPICEKLTYYKIDVYKLPVLPKVKCVKCVGTCIDEIQDLPNCRHLVIDKHIKIGNLAEGCMIEYVK